MHPFLIFYLASIFLCGLIQIFGVIVDKWKGEGTTAKDVILGAFLALIPLINCVISVILFFYVLGEVLKKADTIQVVKGK